MSKKTAKIRDLSAQELESSLVDLRSGLAKEKALAVSGTKAQKPSNIRKLRREIARTITILKEKKEVKKK